MAKRSTSRHNAQRQRNTHQFPGGCTERAGRAYKYLVIIKLSVAFNRPIRPEVLNAFMTSWKSKERIYRALKDR